MPQAATVFPPLPDNLFPYNYFQCLNHALSNKFCLHASKIHTSFECIKFTVPQIVTIFPTSLTTPAGNKHSH